MKYTYLLFIIALPFFAGAQRLSGDLYAGVANYQGDLQGSRFTFSQAGPAIGLGVSYNITNRLIARTAFTYARIAGNDKLNKEGKGVDIRNLNFKSNIWELQLAAEFNLLDLEYHSFAPYIFAGAAVFRHNPFTFDQDNNKVFLQPLSTEGQGLAEYPDRSPYSLTQFAIPFGGGVKLRLSDRVQIAGEIGLRKLFTDYIDDVSTNYADSAILATAKGPLAAELAYRGDELPQGGTYPEAGAQRGSPKHKDWYYTTGLKISYRLGMNKGAGRNGSVGCPVF